MSDLFKTRLHSIEPVGVLRMSGSDSADLLHRLSTQALKDLGEGYQVRSTVFTTSQGKMVDWSLVIHTGEEILIRTELSRAERLVEWIDNYIIMDDAQVEDVSSQWRSCVVQGDGATDYPGDGEVSGELVRAHGGGLWFRGLPAFGERMEALVPVAEVSDLRTGLTAAGFVEADQERWEHLRVLAGVPSPAFEYQKEINPLELRLKDEAIAWNKGCYIGQEVISRLDSYDKVKRLLMGFVCDGELTAGVGVKLKGEGSTLGRMTSCVPIPGGGTLGLAIVERTGLDQTVVTLETATGEILEGRLENRPFWGA